MTMMLGFPLDLCDELNGDSEFVFDSNEAEYRFKTIDNVRYTPSTYQLTISGNVGTETVDVVLTLTLVDPCPSVIMTLLSSHVL